MSLLKCKWNHVTPLLNTLQSLLISEQRQCIYNGQMLPSDLSFNCFLTLPLTLSSTPLFTSPPWHYFFFFFSVDRTAQAFSHLRDSVFAVPSAGDILPPVRKITSSLLQTPVKMPSSLVKSSLIIPHKIKPPVLQHPLSSLPEFIVLHCVGSQQMCYTFICWFLLHL